MTQKPAAKTPRDTICIADDDPQMLALLQRILSAQYDVCAAFSGNQAFDLVRQRPPSLVILDVQMPDGDGFETTRRLRSHSATAAIPVLIVTADSSHETVSAAVLAGADELLIKSGMNRTELLDVAQRLIEASRRKASVRRNALSAAPIGPIGTADQNDWMAPSAAHSATLETQFLRSISASTREIPCFDRQTTFHSPQELFDGWDV